MPGANERRCGQKARSAADQAYVSTSPMLTRDGDDVVVVSPAISDVADEIASVEFALAESRGGSRETPASARVRP